MEHRDSFAQYLEEMEKGSQPERKNSQVQLAVSSNLSDVGQYLLDPQQVNVLDQSKKNDATGLQPPPQQNQQSQWQQQQQQQYTQPQQWQAQPPRQQYAQTQQYLSPQQHFSQPAQPQYSQTQPVQQYNPQNQQQQQQQQVPYQNPYEYHPSTNRQPYPSQYSEIAVDPQQAIEDDDQMGMLQLEHTDQYRGRLLFTIQQSFTIALIFHLKYNAQFYDNAIIYEQSVRLLCYPCEYSIICIPRHQVLSCSSLKSNCLRPFIQLVEDCLKCDKKFYFYLLAITGGITLTILFSTGGDDNSDSGALSPIFSLVMVIIFMLIYELPSFIMKVQSMHSLRIIYGAPFEASHSRSWWKRFIFFFKTQLYSLTFYFDQKQDHDNVYRYTYECLVKKTRKMHLMSHLQQDTVLESIHFSGRFENF